MVNILPPSEWAQGLGWVSSGTVAARLLEGLKSALGMRVAQSRKSQHDQGAYKVLLERAGFILFQETG